MSAKRANRKLPLKLTDDQYVALTAMARASEMTLANYLRFRLGLPPERQGARKDLRDK